MYRYDFCGIHTVPNVRIYHFYTIYPTFPAPVVCLTVITAFSVSALKHHGFLICYYILFLQNSRFGTVCSPFLHFFTRGHWLFWTRATNIFKIYELPAFYFKYRYLAWFYTIFYPYWVLPAFEAGRDVRGRDSTGCWPSPFKSSEIRSKSFERIKSPPPPHWVRRAIQPNHIKFRTCSDLAPMWAPPVNEKGFN